MGVVQRQGWTRALHSGRREFHRCFGDRMKRYPDCWGSGSVQTRRAAEQRRQRISQSIVFQIMHKEIRMPPQGLTKMRMPSASCCQRSAIFLSSSSAALEYMEKSGPELSPKFGSPCDDSGWDCWLWGRSAVHVCKFSSARPS